MRKSGEEKNLFSNHIQVEMSATRNSCLIIYHKSYSCMTDLFFPHKATVNKEWRKKSLK